MLNAFLNNDLFGGAPVVDNQTALKMIYEAHYRNWLVVRDDLIELYKYQLSDVELEMVLKLIKM